MPIPSHMNWFVRAQASRPGRLLDRPEGDELDTRGRMRWVRKRSESRMGMLMSLTGRGTVDWERDVEDA